MGRKRKSVVARYDTVVTAKLMLETKRRLDQLAIRAGLRLSSYVARVLETHVEDPQSLALVDLEIEGTRTLCIEVCHDLANRALHAEAEDPTSDTRYEREHEAAIRKLLDEVDRIRRGAK